MSKGGIPLFSVTALAVLDRQAYNPAARGRYELMSGGLIWDDEFPSLGSPEWQTIKPIFVYRYLIAYRASITLGEERLDCRPVWEQVLRHAPNWPGLREDRRDERARRRLLAAKRREARCLDELERHIEGGYPGQAS
jgi:hypothetical protein